MVSHCNVLDLCFALIFFFVAIEVLRNRTSLVSPWLCLEALAKGVLH
jgi:hypothetical protein